MRNYNNTAHKRSSSDGSSTYNAVYNADCLMSIKIPVSASSALHCIVLAAKVQSEGIQPGMVNAILPLFFKNGFSEFR